MADARLNAIPMIPGTYVLMQDVDRYNNCDYETLCDAQEAMAEALSDGEPDMWIGYVDDDQQIQLEEEADYARCVCDDYTASVCTDDDLVSDEQVERYMDWLRDTIAGQGREMRDYDDLSCEDISALEADGWQREEYTVTVYRIPLDCIIMHGQKTRISGYYGSYDIPRNSPELYVHTLRYMVSPEP